MLASDDDVQKSNATETTGPDPGSGVASSAAISLLDNPVIRLYAMAQDDEEWALVEGSEYWSPWPP